MIIVWNGQYEWFICVQYNWKWKKKIRHVSKEVSESFESMRLIGNIIPEEIQNHVVLKNIQEKWIEGRENEKGRINQRK